MSFHVLFIDSYDSFTYNLIQLISDISNDVHVTTIHNDSFSRLEDIQDYLGFFDAICLGPGPGNPINGEKDIGFTQSLFDNKVKIPILGVCLGFQIMCYSVGGKISQLKEIKHGQIFPITVSNECDSLFCNYPKEFNSVRYHSLHVSSINKSIVPLAYTKDENGEVLMAGKINNFPWYGVQYHPESCCSEFGSQLIRNFIDISKKYNISSGRYNNIILPLRNDILKSRQILDNLDKTIDKSYIYEKKLLKEKNIYVEKFSINTCPKLALKICSLLSSPFFLMTSATINPNRGESSIIALPNENSDVFTHYDQLDLTTIHKWRDSHISIDDYKKVLNGSHNNNITVFNQNKELFWKTIGEYMKEKLISDHPSLSFIGGLVGILGYEMGQFTKNYLPLDSIKPDAKLVYIENTILIDHKNSSLYLISLSNNFPNSIKSMIEQVITSKDFSINWPLELPDDITYQIKMPQKDTYLKTFNKLQDYLHKGDSYEICITTQTQITPSKRIDPWRIFQTLIQKNPAPFSSFFEFNDIQEDYSDLCIISTSPERFLKWNSNSCELRPIKGTVKKTYDMTLSKATEILKTPKEFGENLMILDLIRNDLYELLNKVTVDELMSVEEYKTVYQLVSVIKGHELNTSPYSGLDILKHSLPPGSMTGAPKKKTVELLHSDLEYELNKDIGIFGVRGVYSGLTGYMSVNGNGDWSVNIRCMYSYDNSSSWCIGAGGAVTVLSTSDGEWEEMHTKLESALQVFTTNTK